MSETSANDQVRIDAMTEAARKFYGAAVMAQTGLTDRQAGRIAKVASKSWAEDYLIKKFGVDRYDAHWVTNRITYLNLSNIADHPAHYVGCDFYNEWVQLLVGQRVHATAMPDDSVYLEVKGEVVRVNSEWVTIRADQVLDRYSDEWYPHPSSCLTSTLLVHVEVEVQGV